MSGALRRRGWRLGTGGRVALWTLVVMRIALGVAAVAAFMAEPTAPTSVAWTELVMPADGLGALLSTWQRFDALWYQRISEAGYAAGDDTAAFFPLYPLLTRVAAVPLFGQTVLAQLAVASAAFFAAVWLLFVLARRELGRRVALLTVALTVSFPTAFFLLAPYTEGLFLALTLASFALARSGKPWLAGIAGFAAALTRMQGALLVLPLAYEQLRQRDARRPGAHIVASLLPPLGLLAVTLFHRVIVGETRTAMAVQAMWGYQVVAPWTAIGTSLSFIASGADTAVEMLNLGSLLAAAALAVVALRRLPLMYGLYAVPYVGLLFTRQMGEWPLMSVSRFVVVLFPCYIAAAFVLRRRLGAAVVLVITGLLLQGVLLSYWVRWGFVA